MPWTAAKASRRFLAWPAVKRVALRRKRTGVAVAWGEGVPVLTVGGTLVGPSWNAQPSLPERVSARPLAALSCHDDLAGCSPGGRAPARVARRGALRARRRHRRAGRRHAAPGPREPRAGRPARAAAPGGGRRRGARRRDVEGRVARGVRRDRARRGGKPRGGRGVPGATAPLPCRGAEGP